MSYSRQVGNTLVFVNCASNPEGNYAEFGKYIANRIIEDGYQYETSLENLVSMVILSFDCDDNYGEYDPETGMGGYGDSFSIEECFRYVEESGGWKEFDYWV